MLNCSPNVINYLTESSAVGTDNTDHLSACITVHPDCIVENGTIEFDEFLAMMATVDVNPSGDLKRHFEQFDKDNNGKINKAELKQILESLGEKMSNKEITAMMKEGDTDGDGEITYEGKELFNHENHSRTQEHQHLNCLYKIVSKHYVPK